MVMNAIIAVAKREEEFTTDAIWHALGGAVPVTSEMIVALRLASKRGILDSTGKTVASSRKESQHDERLVVWYSLIRET
jgi:hypothetical protein